MSIGSSTIPSLPGKVEMPCYMWEIALAKGEVQQRTPSVSTATGRVTSKWNAGPKEAEKKTKDLQVKDREMVANLLPILPPPPPPLHLRITSRLQVLPTSKLGKAALSWTQVQLHISAQIMLSSLLLRQ
jgi:hypothetical protein